VNVDCVTDRATQGLTSLPARPKSSRAGNSRKQPLRARETQQAQLHLSVAGSASPDFWGCMRPGSGDHAVMLQVLAASNAPRPAPPRLASPSALRQRVPCVYSVRGVHMWAKCQSIEQICEGSRPLAWVYATGCERGKRFRVSSRSLGKRLPAWPGIRAI
jgi:hypothetical protein